MRRPGWGWWLFAFVALPIAIAVWLALVQVTTKEIRQKANLDPLPVTTTSSLPVQAKLEVVAPKIYEGSFGAEWLGSEGREYLWEQHGKDIKLFWLQPDGGKRYVGDARDEGDSVVFSSFYSPVYKQWGTLPRLVVKGTTLVAVKDDGTEVVYFRRPS